MALAAGWAAMAQPSFGGFSLEPPGVSASSRAGGTSEGPATSAALLLEATQAPPGSEVWAAVKLTMKPGWHTYWRNPGESGMATEIAWTLPEGIEAGAIQWPLPEIHTASDITTYVYHDEVLLLVPLRLAPDLAPGEHTLKARVSWLECMEACLPGDAEVSAVLKVGSPRTPSDAAEEIARWREQVPRPDPRVEVSAHWEGPAEGEERTLLIEGRGPEDFAPGEFLAYTGGNWELRPGTIEAGSGGGRFLLRKTAARFDGDWPAEIPGLLAMVASNRVVRGVEVTLRPGDVETPPAVAAAEPAPSAAGGSGSLWGKLLVAFLGGLILNLMPCVLPILSLKVLGLVRQSAESAAERRRHGVVYTLGVLVSFWTIGGLVVAGRLVSWGQQFQDPRFVVGVTVLVTVVALNLFGLFEVILPGGAATSAHRLASREGLAGSFFNGVLAVVLGASCVAPMLATAAGWAMTQSPPVIMAAFTMIGLGLASPFLALSWFPGLQRVMPKPGPWMETFRVVLGFPMLATAIWLLSIVGDQWGTEGVLWVGLFLVFVGLAAWVYGRFGQLQRRGWARWVALAVLAVGYGWTLERELDWRHPAAAGSGDASASLMRRENGIPWQPWSPEAVAAARAEGRPVLVDFTAQWCLTCKLNERTSLEIDEVRRKLEELNVVALKGDYTRRDPRITAELRRFGRAGVPLVLVYPADPSRPPEVLPTLLTPSAVLQALDRAAAGQPAG